MNASKVLEQVIRTSSSQPQCQADLLNLILPVMNETYSFDQIDDALARFHEEIETLQRESNDRFDLVLDGPIQDKLKCLSNDLDKTQEDIMKLNCNIANARRQFQLVQDACRDKVVHQRQEMLQTEKSLRKSLQQSKFNSVQSFFERFVVHTDHSISTCRKLLTKSASINYLQALDWAQYHQIMFLLRACGQAMLDVEKFERLYQSYKDFFGLSFRQPLDKMDLNNFIEFHVTYSLETQLDVVINSQGDRVQFGSFIKGPDIELVLNPGRPLEYELFKQTIDNLSSLTVECCRLLVDLNLNHIEAYLTDGINIDKLNGYDTNKGQGASNLKSDILPSYAFSPQDSITQIGQHLLSIKKQTEKFDQIDNRPLLLALDCMKYVSSILFDTRACVSVTDVILKFIARQVVRSLVGRTTSSVLSQLSANGRRQLTTDASYLNSVLEDLNLVDPSDPSAEKFKMLLVH